jgi:CRP-like cAMP-binding protein
MSITLNNELLEQYGAALIQLGKGEMLFAEGDVAAYFYLVKTGRVKMSNFSEQGREFIQGYFSDGQSFGEPPFFAEMQYPATATATETTEVWRISRERFMQLVQSHTEIGLELLRTLSERLMYKSMMLSEVAVEEAAHRLRSLMEFMKNDRGIPNDKEFVIPYTRQQLADMTGLRVETVIRTIKMMERDKVLEIIEGKIFLLPKKRTYG